MTPIHCTQCGGFTAKPRDGACAYCGYTAPDNLPAGAKIVHGSPGEVIEYDPRCSLPRRMPTGQWFVPRGPHSAAFADALKAVYEPALRRELDELCEDIDARERMEGGNG